MDRQTMVSLTSLLLQEEREIGRWNPKGGTSQEAAFHAKQSVSSDGGNNQSTQHALYAHPSTGSSHHNNRNHPKRGGRSNARHQHEKDR